MRSSRGTQGREAQTLREVRVAPNPAQDHILVIGLVPDVDLNIVDELGRICFTAKPRASALRIETTSFVQGHYTVIQPGADVGRSAQFQIIR